MDVVVRMPLDPPCPFSCPDWAFMHAEDCVLSRHLAAWDAVDAVALRVLGSPLVRPTRLVERAIKNPQPLGDWVLVERHEKYGLPFVYYLEDV
jgi:hypothetical protein